MESGVWVRCKIRVRDRVGVGQAIGREVRMVGELQDYWEEVELRRRLAT